ncbi:MAG: hypothetical protein OEY14_14890, partial [Myxococcales bacterium]|nr:hypothetical protein [Myxococcales bacterium]
GIGGDSDRRSLEAIAEAGRGHHIPFVPGQRTTSAAIAVLETTYGASLEAPTLELPDGIEAIAPERLPTLRAGKELFVVGRLSRAEIQGRVRLHGKLGGREWTGEYELSLETSESSGNAFVPRIWAAQSIEALERGGRGEDIARIVALSKGFGVMSEQTSLLVLESEAMFRAFGVDRARPTLQWTGEEEMEMGLSGEGLGGGGSRGQAGVGRFGSMGAVQGSSSLAGLGGGGRGSIDGLLSSAPRPQAAAAPRAEPAEARVVADEDAEATQRRPRRATPRPPRNFGRRRGPSQLMRKVWFREGHIRALEELPQRELDRVRRSEDALRANPDSRDRHRELVRALSRAGQLERAQEVAEAWLERDRMDPQALTYLADVHGRRGERAQAIRLLSGIVDLEPENVTLQRRLAAAFERVGKADRACAHRVTLAELRPEDSEDVARAVQCERALGRAPAATRLLEMLRDEGARREVERELMTIASPRRLRGELMLEANWTGSADVDLSLITPQGTRLSWMGGRTNVVGEDAGRVGRERLGVGRASRGTYYIEVSRANPLDTSAVRGEIEIRVLGERRTLRFDLRSERALVGSVQVARNFRLERVR